MNRNRTIATVPAFRLTPGRLVGLLVLLALGLLAGCSNKAQQFWNDAPRTQEINSAPAEVISMPDGFNNLATKCDHGNRVYVSFHGNSAYGFGFAVPHDPTCATSTAAATRAHTTAAVSSSRRCGQTVHLTRGLRFVQAYVAAVSCGRRIQAWGQFRRCGFLTGSIRTTAGKYSVAYCSRGGGTSSRGYRWRPRTGGVWHYVNY